MKNKYPQLVVDWKKIYSLPFTVTVETKIRDIDIVYTNVIKMIESPLCKFCQKEDEFLEHLLFHCKITKTFGLQSHPGIVNKTYSTKHVLFGYLTTMKILLF